jgi:hypothetical protein
MWGACYAFAPGHSFLARVAGADRLGVEVCHVLRHYLARGSNRIASSCGRLFSS